MALGYGNFDTVIQYDIYAMAERFVADGKTWNINSFKGSDYYLNFDLRESSILNSPNLSILPLLAYHKICNDHYRNEKWQPLGCIVPEQVVHYRFRLLVGLQYVQLLVE